MLTIIPTDRNQADEARITIPEGTTHADRQRLDALASVFYAHHVRGPQEAYVMTEMRGRKCWQLWQAGFSAVPAKSKNHRCCITHPKVKKPMHIFRALELAGLVEPVGVHPAAEAVAKSFLALEEWV